MSRFPFRTGADRSNEGHSVCPPARSLPRSGACLKRFVAANAGATAMLFALSLLPVTIAVGAAVDYSAASNVKARLDSAIDAAALETVSRGMLPESAATARTNGLKVFGTQASNVTRTVIENVELTVTDTVATRKTAATYVAHVSTAFMGIVGFPSIAISGTASTASVLAPYIDFHLLLDNTPSMGVAATPADIAKMMSVTPNQCAFACHDLSANGNDNYKLAKKNNIKMRIDVMRTATEELMDTAKASAYVPKQFRMAIHTFGEACVKNLGMTTVSELSYNLNQSKKEAGKIDLMTIEHQNYFNDQCTNYNAALTALNAAVATPGPGTSENAPQKIVFFVSDGVADAYNPSKCSRPTVPEAPGRCQEPIDVSLCKTLKDRGIKVAVLYTTYLPLPTDGWYMKWIAPFSSQINPAMANCASPGLFFEVSPTQGISEAMTALFQKAIAQARFTN